MRKLKKYIIVQPTVEQYQSGKSKYFWVWGTSLNKKAPGIPHSTCSYLPFHQNFTWGKGWITTAFDHTSEKNIISKLIIFLWNKILWFACVTCGDYWIFSFINLGILDQLDEFPCIFYTFATISTIKKRETWKFSPKRNCLLNQHKWVEGLLCNQNKMPT